MFVRVQGASFKRAVNDILQNGKRVAINVTVNKNKMFIQTLDTVLDEFMLEIEQTSDDAWAASFEIDQTLSLLGEDTVSIELVGELVTIRQKSIAYTTVVLAEARVELQGNVDEGSRPFDKRRFIECVDDVRALDAEAKILASSYASLNICDGVLYASYASIAYSNLLDLDNMVISGETARKLCKVLKRANNPTYTRDEETGALTIKVSNVETVTVMTGRCTASGVQAIKEIVEGVEPVTTSNVREYSELLSTICTVYKKLLVELSICQNGIRVITDSSGIRFDMGSREEPILSIKITTAQLQAIVKLFKSNTEVDIKRKGNCVCLQSKSLIKKLIVSGVIY